MRITGTKKLLLIFLTLICAFAMGLGIALHNVVQNSNTANDTNVESSNKYEGSLKLAESTENYNVYEEEDKFIAPDNTSNYGRASYPQITDSFGWSWYSDESKLGPWTYNIGTQSSELGWTVMQLEQYKPVIESFSQTATVYLKPGETFTLYWTDLYASGVGNWVLIDREDHVADSFYSENRQEIQTCYVTIDKDAPTGTVYSGVICDFLGQRLYPNQYFGTGGNTGIRTSHWLIRLIVERLPQEKPTLVNDGNVVGDTKYVTYDGNPATFSFTPDFGLGTLSWTSDSSVSLQSRYDCHASGYLTLGSSVAGTHVITLYPAEGQWADGTSTRLTFKLVVGTQTTMIPTMQRDVGVASNGLSKYVNDTGEKQTITFLNCDPRYVGWTANGMYLDSWENNTLTLWQDQQGTFSISLYLLVPSACTWTNNTTTDQTFTFTIGPMAIEKPYIQGQPTNNTKTVTYNGSAQNMVLENIEQGTLTIRAPGLPFDYGDDNTAVFTTTNAANFTVTISPAPGYCWSDLSTNEIQFKFTINAVRLTAPVLKDTGSNVNGNTKTVVYDPDGSYGEINIGNLDRDGLSIISSLTELDWNANSEGSSIGTITLGAQNAETYLIDFLPNTNYEWAPGVKAPTFVLIIERYTLGTAKPHIVISDEEDAATKLPATVPDENGKEVENTNKISIVGNTKTVDYRNPSQKYITIYVGGLADQFYLVTAGLNAVWDTEAKTLTLSGTEASNYLIQITPTSNYKWVDDADGMQDTALKDFKLVISAILRDSIPIYKQDTSGHWTYESSKRTTVQYDTHEKYFRIGDQKEDDVYTYFDSEAMTWDLVNDAGQLVSHPEGFGLSSTNDGTNGILEFYAVNAGTYIIRLQLKDSNYAWRDGSTVNVYYTFTVTAMPIDTPRLVAEECGGNDTQGNVYGTYMYGRFDGNAFTMAIAVRAASFITATFPYDDNLGNIWQGEWNFDDKLEVDRLFVHARNVGTHTVRLQITDKNYRWADETKEFYDFELIIDYARVNGVDFYYDDNKGENSLTNGEKKIGGNNSSYSDATFETNVTQYVIVRRAADEFKDTPFYELDGTGKNIGQFTFNIINADGYDHSEVIIEKDYFKIPVVNAGQYIIQIGLTDNYSWSNGKRTPYQFTLSMSAKVVDLPKMFDNYNEGNVTTNASGAERLVEYEFDTKRQIMIELGDDFEAFCLSEYSSITGYNGVAGEALVKDTDHNLTQLEGNYASYVDSDGKLHHVFAYTAINAGTYHLYVQLANQFSTPNYVWNMGDHMTFTLRITQRQIDLPEVWVTSKASIDYSTVKGDADSKQISSDIHYSLNLGYIGSQYYVYVLDGKSGDTIRNEELDISVEPETNNYDGEFNPGLYHKTEQNGAQVTTSYLFTPVRANTYTITVKLKVNAYNNTTNYIWAGVADSELSADRVFTFTIDKVVVDVPTIDGWAQTVENNTQYAYFTYAAGTHQSIDVIGINFGTTSYPFVKVDKSDMAKYSSSGSTVTLTTNQGDGGAREAIVAGVYWLSISVDEKNARWRTDTDELDFDTKYFYIVIEKAPVDIPTISTTLSPDVATVDQSNLQVSVVYNGEKWSPAMTLSGLDSRYISYKLATPATTYGVALGETYTISTLSAEAGYYTVVVSLADPGNLMWAGLNGDSSDLNVSFVIKPKLVNKPLVIDESSIYPSAVYTDTSMTVTFNYDYYGFKIENYLSDTQLMSVSVIAALFESSVEDAAAGKLSYTAKKAGRYVVRFTLTGNAEWDDGTGNYGGSDPIDLILLIEKLQFDTPFIVNDIDPDDAVTQINGNTKSTVYKFVNGAGVSQSISIGNYDDQIMSLSGLVSSVNEQGIADPSRHGVDLATGYYVVNATLASTVTIRFRIKDFENTRWDFDDVEEITFIFQIDKLELANPVIADQYLLELESVTDGNTLSSVFDSRLHTALVENILTREYMTFRDTSPYNDSYKDRLDYDRTPTANTYVNGVDNTAGYLTVADIYGFGSTDYLQNGVDYTTEVEDKFDYILMRVTQPGSYSLTVTLTDNANMCWQGGNISDQVITIVINKMAKPAPSIQGASGLTQTKQYEGGYVYFTINDVYNGVEVEGGPVVGYEYNQYTLGRPITSVQNPVWEVVSWYGGVMTLRAVEVGTYSITIKIRNTDTTVWTNTTDTERTFTFTVDKRTVGVEYSFEPSESITYNGSTPTWAMSTPVTATITLTDVRARETGVIDKNVAIEIFFVSNSNTSVHRNSVIVTSADFVQELQADGTYHLSYDFALPYGEDEMSQGAYTIYVVQNGSAGNYIVNQSTQQFRIAADAAPFDPDMLVWQYRIDDGSLVTVDLTADLQEDGALHLPYLTDGGTYFFSVTLTAEGMDRFGTGTPRETFEAALADWEVRVEGTPQGASNAYAGSYTFSIRITALDQNLFFFPTTTYSLKYVIDPVKYDLSGLEWDYDSDNPFVFDNTAKYVKVTGNFPAGLTVYSYLVDGCDFNSQTYGGSYNTSVIFTSANKNYLIPDANDPDTYEGTFDWFCNWTIEKAELEVSWSKSATVNGATISYIPVLTSHSDKVTYTYYLHNGTDFEESDVFVTGLWKVSATLISDPEHPAYDYARSYTLKFVDENGDERTDPDEQFNIDTESAGGGINVVLKVGNRDDDGEVNGTQIIGNTNGYEFMYNGKPFEADFIGITCVTGLVTADNVKITYYNANNLYKALPGAPTEVGNYVIKLSLVNMENVIDPNDPIEYNLIFDTFYFSIIKGTFDVSEFTWKLTHTPLGGTEEITATYDADNDVWLNDADNTAVDLVYDGAAYTLTLVSSYGEDVIKATYKNASKQDAGSYTTTVVFSYDSTKWNVPDSSLNSISWSIRKAVLSLSQIEWTYTGEFEYEQTGGKAKDYSVTLNNIPELLTDYVSYSTTRGDAAVENANSQAGEYVTTCTIAEFENANYEVGEWPASVPQSLTWKIAPKVISIPESSGTWEAYDGRQHNLLTAISLITEWKEYFSITVKFNNAAYNGTSAYGYEFTAQNAGAYTFTLKLNSGINGNNVVNVGWASGDDVVTGDQTVTLNVAKAEMYVDSWYGENELAKAHFTGNYILEKAVSYDFYRDTGSGIVAANKVTLDTVLSSNGGENFLIVPYVKSEYGSNIVLTYAPGKQYYSFTTLLINADPDAQIQVAKKPHISGYMLKDENLEDVFIPFEDVPEGDHVFVIYSGSEVRFVIDMWEEYYENYLEVWGGDSLTQSEAGLYTITLMLKKDTEHPLYWSRTENADGTYTYDRSSVTLTFEIKYRMLDLPELEEVEYDGEEVDILQASLGEDYDALIESYGEYVDITGNTATDAGTYTLYLTIKDEYLNTVRWDNGTSFGQPGTYELTWKINPIRIRRPQLAAGVTITYDGKEHSIFELLDGYSETGLSPELAKLMQYVRISSEGSRGINASDTYLATFTLINSNFIWVDEYDVPTSDGESISLGWAIARQRLDFSKLDWNNPSAKFEYTLVNGEVQKVGIELVNLPIELQEYVYYLTYFEDGSSELTNKASEIGSYRTVVYFMQDEVDFNNFELGDATEFRNKYHSEEGFAEITWSITQRQFTIPVDNQGDWSYFDGDIHDLMKLLGFEEGWDEYLTVKVEYDGDGKGFKDYEGIDGDPYMAFKIGSYRITLKIKEEINADGTVFVTWADADWDTEITVTITCDQLVIDDFVWNEQDQHSTVSSSIFDGLPDSVKEMFEYVIYDADIY